MSLGLSFFPRLTRVEAVAWHLAALSALSAVLFFLPLDNFPFFNKGEPREGLVVQAILLRGEWLLPLKNGSGIPSKPPLFHWLGALVSLAWGGLNEVTLRLPSALCATVGVFALYWLGRRAFDEQVGFLGAVILATSVGYQSEAISARVDMTLAGTMVLSLALFYALYRGVLCAEAWYYLWFFLLGLGVLAKGPVSLILVVLIIGSFLIWQRRWDLLRRLCWHPGVVLAFAVAAAWYLLALVEGGEEWLQRQLVQENLARFFVHGEGGTGHQKPFYYYFPYLLLDSLPWSLVLPLVLVDACKRKVWTEENKAFLLLWVLVVFVFFSLSAGKRSPYLLPLYPALSVLIATWFVESGESDRWERAGALFAAGLCALTGLSVLSIVVGMAWHREAGWFLSPVASFLRPKDRQNLWVVQEAFNQRGWLAGLLFVGLSLLLLASAGNLWRGRRSAVPLLLTCAFLLAAGLSHGVVLPAIAGARSYAPFMHEVNRLVAGERIFLYGGGFDAGPVVFYHGREIPALEATPPEMAQNLLLTHHYFIMSEKEYETVVAVSGAAAPPLVKSTGKGPGGDARLVLVRGTAKRGAEG